MKQETHQSERESGQISGRWDAFLPGGVEVTLGVEEVTLICRITAMIAVPAAVAAVALSPNRLSLLPVLTLVLAFLSLVAVRPRLLRLLTRASLSILMTDHTAS